MALLAEQKRKTKFGLDPRNTSWSNDSSKFGQRLMEKMGWEKGKGLGAHENGITEHIKASYKSDSRGLGCTSQDADAWIAHQDDFNDLLKALNSQSEANSEEKAEQTKQTKHVDGHRRYYGRFSRGQVQTLRSTDDLDCIFGKRKRKSKTAEPAEEPETKLGCSDDKEEKRHGLTTVTSTSSVQEYFAQKMAEMKARKETNNRENSSVEADSCESTQGRKDSVDCEDKKKSSVYSTFSFSYNDHEMKEVSSSTGADEAVDEQKCRGWYQDFLENPSSNIQNIEVKKKSSKKKKQKKMKSDNEDNDCDVEIMSNSKKCKTKKECKEKILDDSVTINSHASLESSESPSTGKVKEKKRTKKNKDNVTIEPCEENKQSKKKKIKENETVMVTEPSCSSTSNIDDGSEDKKKQKKKKRKTCNKDEIVDNNHNNSALDEINIKNKTADAISLKHPPEGPVIYDNETNNAAHEQEKENTGCDGRKKKNKKRKHCEKYSDRECPVESKHDKDDDDDAMKKSKKRKHCEKYSDDECPVEIKHNDDDAIKKKKKKRRKDVHTSESDEETRDDDDDQGSADSATAKHKSTTPDAENQNIANITESSEQPENKINEKKRQKKKKKKTKLVKDQCTKSNTFFPGSNIAEIVGYGLNKPETEKCSKKNSKNPKKKKLRPRLIKQREPERRKDVHTSEPDNKETRDDDDQGSADSATAKHKSITPEAENQNIANITESSEQPENKINEKKRQKKKNKD